MTVVRKAKLWRAMKADLDQMIKDLPEGSYIALNDSEEGTSQSGSQISSSTGCRINQSHNSKRNGTKNSMLMKLEK